MSLVSTTTFLNSQTPRRFHVIVKSAPLLRNYVMTSYFLTGRATNRTHRPAKLIQTSRTHSMRPDLSKDNYTYDLASELQNYFYGELRQLVLLVSVLILTRIFSSVLSQSAISTTKKDVPPSTLKRRQLAWISIHKGTTPLPSGTPDTRKYPQPIHKEGRNYDSSKTFG